MSSVTEGTLVATTQPLDADVDLIDVCGDDGHLWIGPERGLAGRGTAAEINIDTSEPARAASLVGAALRSIDHRDQSGLAGADRSPWAPSPSRREMGDH